MCNLIDKDFVTLLLTWMLTYLMKNLVSAIFIEEAKGILVSFIEIPQYQKNDPLQV